MIPRDDSDEKSIGIGRVLAYMLLVVFGILGAWGLYSLYVRAKPEPPKPIPKFPDTSKTMMTLYFEKNPTESADFDREFRDALRLVPDEYKLNMLERCVKNATAASRKTAVMCAFYKLARVWAKEPTAFPFENLMNLLALSWVVESDALKLRKRTDLFSYDSTKGEIRVMDPKFAQEIKKRVQILVDKGYAVPTSVQQSIQRSEEVPFVLPDNVFLYAMLETYLKFIPDANASCALCV